MGCVCSSIPDLASVSRERSQPSDQNSGDDVLFFELGPFTCGNGSPVLSEVLNIIFWQLPIRHDRFDEEGARESEMRVRRRPRLDVHEILPGVENIPRP
jgi:hypothetical protein